MNLLKEDRINYLNIGLMLITAILAYYFPFETFLLAYAYLGPLHYLTEISWLHDRQYFAKGKWDYLVLLVIGILLSLDAMFNDLKMSNDFVSFFNDTNLSNQLLIIAIFSGIVFALIKNFYIKLGLIGLFYLIIVRRWLHPSNDIDNTDSSLIFTLTSLIPTLIHVYVFTGLFMLYGALKSRSKSGLLQMVGFILFPLILVFGLPSDSKNSHLSGYGKDAYYADGEGFYNTNYSILNHFNLFDNKLNNKEYLDIVSNPTTEKALIQNKIIDSVSYYKHIDSLKQIQNNNFILSKQPINPQIVDQGGHIHDHVLYFFNNDTNYVKRLDKYKNVAMPKDLWISPMGKERKKSTDNLIFFSEVGIMLMRFIAFAYLYHYLNWFSKTEVIRWHKVPKVRFILVVVLWLAAAIFYSIDYKLGLSVLFFLSFTHVLLEFPLNFISIAGIGTESLSIFKNGFKKKPLQS